MINHKTVKFDFPMIEDSDSVYLEEYSHEVYRTSKLFWIIELKYVKCTEYTYELHMPKGQFEKQDIKFY